MQNILHPYIEILRHETRLPRGDANVLAIALLSWARLHQLYPEQVKSSPLDFQDKPRQAADELERLDHSTTDLPLGFSQAARAWDDIGKLVQVQLLDQLRADISHGRLSEFLPVDIVPEEALELRPELAELMVELGGKELGKGPAYLPWAASAQLAGRVLMHGGVVHAEVQVQGFHPLGLIAALLDMKASVHLQIGDPIIDPSFQDKGRLNQYDLVLATPPFNLRLEGGRYTADRYDRFAGETSSGNAMSIRHVMSQLKGRAVILVTNTVLFSGSDEKNLRKDLLEMGVLEAVISLPPGQIVGSQVSTSLLILNYRERCNVIRMVSLEKEGEYVFKESRSNARLRRVENISKLVYSDALSPYARSVPHKEILENDLSFMPSRYVISDELAKVDDLLAAYEMRPLDAVADVIRTLANPRPLATVDALEVGAVDLNDSGFLSAPTKQVQTQYISEKDTGHFLRPNDVIVVFKGSVGKAGICPDNVPAPGPGGWVVGQSMVIVRCKPGMMSPKTLVTLLRSSVGKALLSRITEGAIQPFVKANALRSLPIPIPSMSESAQIDAIFDEQARIQAQIQSLQTLLDERVYAKWSRLPDSAPREIE